jgi:hemoglobin
MKIHRKLIPTCLAVLLCLAVPALAQEASTDADEAAIVAEEARLEAEEAAIAAEEARLEAEEAEATGIPGLRPGALPPSRDPTAPDPAPVFAELRPVFADFGGEAGLTALMETFMAGLLADERMRPFFAQSDQVRVKRQLVEQFCAILGGGCAYSGRDMKSAHAGLGIDRADFNRLVEVLQVAMDAHDVPFRAQNRLLAKLAPMHREMVTE